MFFSIQLGADLNLYPIESQLISPRGMGMGTFFCMFSAETHVVQDEFILFDMSNNVAQVAAGDAVRSPWKSLFFGCTEGGFRTLWLNQLAYGCFEDYS